MDSTFLEGQTETRLVLQVSNTSSMVLMESQQSHSSSGLAHDVAARATQI